FEDADEPLDTEIPVANKIVLGVSIVVILLFFVGLSPLLETAGVAADSLMAQL
ncbi:MAG: NADH-quinone oxidoreductase subunit N, partial [Alphaproteobacteria bacterium]|nr:NADH-quinone oxidoreductase subunit N [Alphaproteobacteria bacterium]